MLLRSVKGNQLVPDFKVSTIYLLRDTGDIKTVWVMRTAWNRTCAVSSPGFLSGVTPNVRQVTMQDIDSAQLEHTWMSGDGEFPVRLLDF